MYIYIYQHRLRSKILHYRGVPSTRERAHNLLGGGGAGPTVSLVQRRRKKGPVLEGLGVPRAASEGKSEGSVFLAPPMGLTIVIRVVGGGLLPPTFGRLHFLRFLVWGCLGSGRWGSTWGRKGSEPLEVVLHTNAGRKAGVAEHTGVQHSFKRTGALANRRLMRRLLVGFGAVLGLC